MHGAGAAPGQYASAAHAAGAGARPCPERRASAYVAVVQPCHWDSSSGQPGRYRSPDPRLPQPGPGRRGGGVVYRTTASGPLRSAGRVLCRAPTARRAGHRPHGAAHAAPVPADAGLRDRSAPLVRDVADAGPATLAGCAAAVAGARLGGRQPGLRPWVAGPRRATGACRRARVSRRYPADPRLCRRGPEAVPGQATLG